MSTANGSNNEGHGHVYPRPDGVRARCGGAPICPECALDLAQKFAFQQLVATHKIPATSAAPSPALDYATLHALVTAIVSRSRMADPNQDQHEHDRAALRATLLIRASREEIDRAPDSLRA